MNPLAVLLAVAVAAGPSAPAKRTGLDVSNAARARAGLLPRKPARPRASVRGRYATVRPSAPTYLADPAPVAGADAADGDADASPDVATAEGDGSAPAAPVLAVARGPVETKRLPDAPAPGEPDSPAAAPAADAGGALRAEATGVVTELTLSMRFDP